MGSAIPCRLACNRIVQLFISRNFARRCFVRCLARASRSNVRCADFLKKNALKARIDKNPMSGISGGTMRSRSTVVSLELLPVVGQSNIVLKRVFIVSPRHVPGSGPTRPGPILADSTRPDPTRKFFDPTRPDPKIFLRPDPTRPGTPRPGSDPGRKNWIFWSNLSQIFALRQPF